MPGIASKHRHWIVNDAIAPRTACPFGDAELAGIQVWSPSISRCHPNRISSCSCAGPPCSRRLRSAHPGESDSTISAGAGLRGLQYGLDPPIPGFLIAPAKRYRLIMYMRTHVQTDIYTRSVSLMAATTMSFVASLTIAVNL